jgi:hypothetical protein
LRTARAQRPYRLRPLHSSPCGKPFVATLCLLFPCFFDSEVQFPEVVQLFVENGLSTLFRRVSRGLTSHNSSSARLPFPPSLFPATWLISHPAYTFSGSLDRKAPTRIPVLYPSDYLPYPQSVAGTSPSVTSLVNRAIHEHLARTNPLYFFWPVPSLLVWLPLDTPLDTVQ